MAESAVLLAALGIVSTCVLGLLWIIKYMFNKINPVLNRVAISAENNTKATKYADKYLRERNGRDNAVHTELIQAVRAIPSQIIESAHVTAKELVKHPSRVKIQTVKVEDK